MVRLNENKCGMARKEMSGKQTTHDKKKKKKNIAHRLLLGTRRAERSNDGVHQSWQYDTQRLRCVDHHRLPYVPRSGAHGRHRVGTTQVER